MPYAFSAIRGLQGTTTYYTANLQYGEVAQLTILPEDAAADRIFKETGEMQRKLSWSRVKNEIVTYLTDCPDAFFSSLALVVIPRDLQGLEEEIHYRFTPVKEGSSMGTLEFFGSIFFFPADGQHRTAGIKEAITKEPGLAGRDVPVVFIPFSSSDEVRQLFADLNLNAKPVNKTIGLAFDNRSASVVLTKAVAREIPLFAGRVNRRSNSLPRTSDDVITMNVLNSATRKIVEALPPTATASMGLQHDTVIKVWNTIINAIPEWEALITKQITPADKASQAGTLRDQYFFGYAVGWEAIANVAALLLKLYPEEWESRITQALKAVDWSRGNPDWNGLIALGDKVVNSGAGITAGTGYVLAKAGISSSPLSKAYLDAFEGASRKVAALTTA